MRLLKVAINSCLSGLFFGLLLTFLFADLNITMKITLPLVLGLSLRLAVVYGSLVFCLCLLAFFIIQFFSGRKITIAAISPSFLLLSFSLFNLLFLLFFQANVSYFASFFDSRLRPELQAQRIALFCLAGLGMAIFFGFRRHRGRGLFFLSYFILLAISLTFLLVRRAQVSPEQPSARSMPLFGKKVERKITLVGMPGLNFDLLIPLAAEGKLPNFSWLIENGSSGSLKSFTPAEAVALNSSLSTGKFPAKHRQFSLFRYRFLRMKESLAIVPRFMLFKQLARINLLEITPIQASPVTKDIWQIFEASRILYVRKNGPSSVEVPVQPSPRAEKLWSEILDSSIRPSDEYLTRVKGAFFRDCAQEEKATEEKIALQPYVYYLQLDGLNTVLTYLYKFRFPEQFGSLDQDQIDRYGPVIDRYYDFYDEIIGKCLTGLKEDELLVVFSPHGIEPLPLWKRAIERLLGNPMVSAHHEFAPDGVVFFYGKNVARSKNLEGMRIVDLAPTFLYYLGLPVGRDMDGIARTDVFERNFIADNPVIYISSYDEFEIIPPH